VHRSRFLAGAIALPCVTLSLPKGALAEQEEYDPAVSAPTAALRVLLGKGDASPSPDGFTFNGRHYRGTFTRTTDGAIVSTVPLEEYLYSVVPREMSPSWPAAALQAQAICGRTYVLQRSNPRRNYDLVPSELDQVYGGIASESASARAAVDATAGQVLRYGDRFAEVLYSSCCGGRTEASSDAWGGAPFPYLQSVVCPYCTDSPDYRWQREVPLQSLAQLFADELAPFGALRGVRIGETDESGRAKTIELVAERGSAFVKGSSFRLRVGTRIVRSLLITKLEASATRSPTPDPAQAGQTVAIEGGGLGHGVGLCQWGARGMALDGRSARDIVSLYFPGTSIGND